MYNLHLSILTHSASGIRKRLGNMDDFSKYIKPVMSQPPTYEWNK
jgi:hypothetical protein